MLAAALATYWSGRRLLDFYRRRGAVKNNYRGVAITPALGPALLLGYLAYAAAAVWLGGDPLLWLPVTMVLLGYSLLGLWDDLFDDPTSGFRGHFKSGLRGGLTAGLLKSITAVLVGLIFAGVLDGPLSRRLLALFLVLLSANGVNLLDRRPGRAVKIFFTGAIAVVFLARPAAEAALLLLPVMAAALAVAPSDLSAEGMLGDCGANFLGAALGVVAALYLGTTLQVLLLLFWTAVHLLAEQVSISRLVEGNSWLSYLDSLGRFREKSP